MIINASKTTASRLFFFFLIIVLLFYNCCRSWWWLSFESVHMWSVVRAVGVVLIAGLVVVVARTTMVTWITLVVMLSFVGKRRRVLAVEGRRISGDVVVHLLKVLVRERSLVAVACATVLSSMAMVLVA